MAPFGRFFGRVQALAGSPRFFGRFRLPISGQELPGHQPFPRAPSHPSVPRALSHQSPTTHSHQSVPWALSHTRMMLSPKKSKGKLDKWNWKKKLVDANVFGLFDQGNSFFLQTFGLPIDKRWAVLAIKSATPILRADDFVPFERIEVKFFKCCKFGKEDLLKAIRRQPTIVILRLWGDKFKHHKKGIYSNLPDMSESDEESLHAVVALGFMWTSEDRLAILIQENGTQDWGDDGCSYVDFKVLWRQYFIVTSFLDGGIPKGYREVDVMDRR